jgi:hypothetical protein
VPLWQVVPSLIAGMLLGETVEEGS